MSEFRYCKGVSLLHVLIVLSVMTSLMLLDARYSLHRSDSKAIEYTILQTESLLNGAFSHFQQSGNWPRTPGSGGCASPFARLSFAETRNGWGNDISCHFSGNNYVVEQRIPAKWALYLVNAVGGSSTPVSDSEWSEWSVTLDRHGGAINRVQLGDLSVTSNPGLFSHACGEGETLNAFSGLMAASAHDYGSDASSISSFRDVINGFRINVNRTSPADFSVRYNMYRYRVLSSDPPTNDITETSAISDYPIPYPEPDTPGHDEFDRLLEEPMDGNNNALVHVLHRPSQGIHVALFSWCTPNSTLIPGS